MSHRSDIGYSYAGHTCGRGTNCPISPSAEGFPQDAGLAVPGRLEQLVTLPLSLPQYLSKKSQFQICLFCFPNPFVPNIKAPRAVCRENNHKGAIYAPRGQSCPRNCALKIEGVGDRGLSGGWLCVNLKLLVLLFCYQLPAAYRIRYLPWDSTRLDGGIITGDTIKLVLSLTSLFFFLSP